MQGSRPETQQPRVPPLRTLQPLWRQRGIWVYQSARLLRQEERRRSQLGMERQRHQLRPILEQR
jgi:hypothetical protein